MFKSKRLGKELQKVLVKTHQTPQNPVKMQDSLPPGIVLVDAPDLSVWHMDIQVLDSNPLYQGQTYRLRLKFSDKYPIEAPETIFVITANPQRTIPLHPHIYSNGIVCLDLLGTGWSPIHNVESICVSLQSMLTGNHTAKRPEGDEEFCRRVKPGASTRGLSFMYDDDKV